MAVGPTQSPGVERDRSSRSEVLIARARALLDGGQARPLSQAQISESTVALAAILLGLTQELAEPDEEKRNQKLARLMDDRRGQLFSTLLTDRVPRLTSGRDVVRQANGVLERCGVPRSLGLLERLQLQALKPLSPLIPTLLGHAIRHRIRSEAAPFLIPGEKGKLGQAVNGLKGPGVRVNVNQLGEEVLGHREAAHHMDAYLRLLATPEVDTVSVKISSICAQINVLAFDASLSRISESLERLYRAAIDHGGDEAKLVMLDMEAYRDLELTHRAFTQVLASPEFSSLRAGIVLQAYLPDSHDVQEDLIRWASQRVKAGASPIQMRLVKGANLAVERVEASLMGWALPIYESKTMVDASFKAMVSRAMTPEALGAVRLGIASHNLFDVAYALTLLHQRGIQSGVHFEVLSGMAAALSECLLSLGQEVLVYSPAVAEAHLHSAIAYLVRRLDENTAEDNFLRHSFGMQVGDDAWVGQRSGFLASRRYQKDLDTRPKRQRRRAASPRGSLRFENEPDTDYTLRGERELILPALSHVFEQSPPLLPLYIAGERIEGEPAPGFDPSRPGHVPYHLSLATPEDVDRALDAGDKAAPYWAGTPVSERAKLLRRVAHALRAARPQLIAEAVMDGGKAVTEADAELSEAIDFAEYYATTALELNAHPDLEMRPRGLTVITPPWNFPLAIPLGGAFAALAAGNPAILKPARETALIATRAVERCYEAGLPREVLQLIVAEDEVATALITDRRVHTVVLTGGTATAQLFRRFRPELHLLAETGGKNPTIVSRFADLDLAIDSVVQSAFGHAGQKCSATSLLILPQVLADDPRFRRQLVDAAESMHVGSAWDLDARVTPLIHPPEGALLRALTSLEPGEEWWLEPRPSPDNPRLWSPGIKAGVRPGSDAHLTEFFGPVLSVLIARDLEHALELANQTPYGLTAGFHSLDEAEIDVFCAQMNSGNLYVNRTTTGAIVQRQPFGGRKDSCFGPGAKAGGPNYVTMFCHLDKVSDAGPRAEELSARVTRHLRGLERALPEASDLRDTALRYEFAAARHFRHAHDPSKLRGQDNHFRYQFHAQVLLVAFPGTHAHALAKAVLAALTLGTPFTVVIEDAALHSKGLRRTLGERLITHGGWRDKLRSGRFTRLRALGDAPKDLHTIAADQVAYVDTSPVLENGRIELLKFALEQSVCVDFHRYGHLGLRELDSEDG